MNTNICRYENFLALRKISGYLYARVFPGKNYLAQI